MRILNGVYFEGIRMEDEDGVIIEAQWNDSELDNWTTPQTVPSVHHT